MAEMVWCNSCKKVVWAYDHQPNIDIRGLFNLMKIPCPSCGDEGNFDGWGSRTSFEEIRKIHPEGIYDWWSAMKFIAKQEGVEWCPSEDNRWFPKYHGQLITAFLKDQMGMVAKAPIEEIFPEK